MTWAIVTVRDRKRLLADLAEVWEVSGKEVLERLAKDDPAKLVKIAFGLLPRDVFISVEQKTPGNLEAEGNAAARAGPDRGLQDRGRSLGRVRGNRGDLRARMAVLLEPSKSR